MQTSGNRHTFLLFVGLLSVPLLGSGEQRHSFIVSFSVHEMSEHKVGRVNDDTGFFVVSLATVTVAGSLPSTWSATML